MAEKKNDLIEKAVDEILQKVEKGQLIERDEADQLRMYFRDIKGPAIKDLRQRKGKLTAGEWLELIEYDKKINRLRAAAQRTSKRKERLLGAMKEGASGHFEAVGTKEPQRADYVEIQPGEWIEFNTSRFVFEKKQPEPAGSPGIASAMEERMSELFDKARLGGQLTKKELDQAELCLDVRYREARLLEMRGEKERAELIRREADRRVVAIWPNHRPEFPIPGFSKTPGEVLGKRIKKIRRRRC